MRTVAKVFIRFLIISAVVKGIAVLIAKLFESETTATDNDFKLLAVMDGRELKSEADSLRTGSATTLMGGIDIDLTKATLDPGGAHLALKAVMGGVQLTVPPDWRVNVQVDAAAGEVDVRTDEVDGSTNGGPMLTVEAFTRMGGIVIRPAKDPVSADQT